MLFASLGAQKLTRKLFSKSFLAKILLNFQTKNNPGASFVGWPKILPPEIHFIHHCIDPFSSFAYYDRLAVIITETYLLSLLSLYIMLNFLRD